MSTEFRRCFVSQMQLRIFSH